MSVLRELEDSNSYFAFQERNSSDDEMMTLPALKKLEKQFVELKSEINQVRARVEQKFEAMEGRFKKIELDVKQLAAVMKSVTNSSTTPSFIRRCLKLQFCNEISSPMLTGEEIKGEGDNSVGVVLVDGTGEVVDSGPEAFAKVEIYALESPFYENRGHAGEIVGFNDDISRQNEEKKSVLVGNVLLKLNKGTGLMSNIKFRSSRSHNSGVFKLGARMAGGFDGIQVNDAMTESFTVNDYRRKYKEKHYRPSLSDDVWRLENIGKNGPIHRRLKGEEINTVEDFLKMDLKDSDRLKHILMLPAKKREATMSHARRCIFDNKADVTKMVADALGHQMEPEVLNDETSILEPLSHSSTVENIIISSGLNGSTGHGLEGSQIDGQIDQTNLNTTSQEIATSSHSAHSTNEVDIGDSCQSPQHGFYCPLYSPLHYYEGCDIWSLFNDDYFSPQLLAGEPPNDLFCVRVDDAEAVIEQPNVRYPDLRKRMVIFFSIVKWLMQSERVVAFERNNRLKKQRVG